MEIKGCGSKNLVSQLTANTLLDEAFLHVSHTQKEAHFNHDIWSIRREWKKIRIHIRSDLLSGRYTFPASKVLKIVDHSIIVWPSKDAIVLKALSLLLERMIYPEVGIYERCYHTKGHGLKEAIKKIKQYSSDFPFIYKTDIKQYYASLDGQKIQESFVCCVSTVIGWRNSRVFTSVGVQEYR